MSQKRISLYVLLALIVISFFYNQYQKSASGSNSENPTTILSELQNHSLYYTKHAKCRMQCRKIDQDEVEEILEHGTINWNKSEVNDQPCATYAIEGRTRDNQNVRIVYANCSRETKVITTIDLDRHYNCSCP